MPTLQIKQIFNCEKIYPINEGENKRVNIGSTDTDGDGAKDAVTVPTHTPLTINNSPDALGD